MAGNRAFDARRFEELVLYISWSTRTDPHFGRTKLAKTLFYSDLAAFAEEGASLTGAVYERWKFGPFPRVLGSTEERVRAEGLATVDRLEDGGRQEEYEELKVRPHAEPTMAVFGTAWNEWQKSLVDGYIAKMSAQSAGEVRDISHLHPGWKITPPLEPIPYHVAYMSRRTPTDRDLARAAQLSRDHQWG